jgi:hypothetical protein
MIESAHLNMLLQCKTNPHSADILQWKDSEVLTVEYYAVILQWKDSEVLTVEYYADILQWKDSEVLTVEYYADILQWKDSEVLTVEYYICTAYNKGMDSKKNCISQLFKQKLI